MTSPRHTATIGAAGSGKTQRLIDGALAAAADGKRVLITTYTIENRNHIERRVAQACGVVPRNVDILTWYRFLINELCHPYQLAFLGQIGVVRSLFFENAPWQKFAKKTQRSYYLTKQGDVYKNRASALALICNEDSDGKVMERLASIYSEIYIDEMQDLAGHDFDLLDVLMATPPTVHLVGDPRQALYFTDDSNKNKKYKGASFVAWLEKRAATIQIEWLNESHRCCQAILDWADALFEGYEPTTSLHDEGEDGDGVHLLTRLQLPGYLQIYGAEVTVLRRQKTNDTMGLPAINIGVSKGATYERVVLFGSRPMVRVASGKDGPNKLSPIERNRLYVAVTRARRSVVIVL
ncbi:MAG: UvrD-helicase domain-containing protein [Gammaproteobacteria bacterium]|nr:UvrD-helicase domain-containing protein [Gammaproteobacteria bacterium]